MHTKPSGFGRFGIGLLGLVKGLTQGLVKGLYYTIAELYKVW